MSQPLPTVIALVGARAAGKTTLGRALAAALDWPCLDTDALLSARVGSSAGSYLARVGEPAFRAAERWVCLEALDAPASATNRVVALGGGAILSPDVRHRLQAPGVLTVHLDPPAACLVDRLRTAPGEDPEAPDPDRPPLTDHPIEQEVEALLAARRSHYEEVSQLRINTFSSNVDACIGLVLAKIGEVS